MRAASGGKRGALCQHQLRPQVPAQHPALAPLLLLAAAARSVGAQSRAAARLGSSWLSSRIANNSSCLKAALSSNPSLASAATSLPPDKARGLTCAAGRAAAQPAGALGRSARRARGALTSRSRRGSHLNHGAVLIKQNMWCSAILPSLPGSALICSPPPWCSPSRRTGGTAP